MSEPVQLAKAAREKLAAALNALQTDDDVPNELLEAAEPIAQAMSVLHRIERTNGANIEGRDGALAAVRTALDRLQKISTSHPAVDVVLESVAGSLSKVHALARYKPPAPVAQPAPAPVAQPAPAPAPVVQAAPQPVVQAAPPPVAQVPAAAKMTMPIVPGPAPSPTFQPQPAKSAQPAPQPQPAPSFQPTPSFQPAPQPAPTFQPAPQAQPAPTFQPAPQAQPVPTPQPAARQVPPDRPSQPKSSVPSIDVELGTHSSSNFYKGLGGNDVLEHGGIFVATYKVLKIGTPVALHVHLPGDYEFHATGVVQWTREGGSSEPGFGARLTQITPDGRQLVYRYARNREPMFYDDL